MSLLPSSNGTQAGHPVSRRRFLKIMLASALGMTALGSVAVWLDWRGLRTRTLWRWRTERYHLNAWRYAFQSPEQRIRKHFSDLMLDEKGLQRFVAEYEKHFGPIRFYTVRSNGRLFSTFLLSSDYYRNGADPGKVVHYVTFYDPYVSPCWNPVLRA